jgi:hypothetical protein
VGIAPLRFLMLFGRQVLAREYTYPGVIAESFIYRVLDQGQTCSHIYQGVVKLLSTLFQTEPDLAD